MLSSRPPVPGGVGVKNRRKSREREPSQWRRQVCHACCILCEGPGGVWSAGVVCRDLPQLRGLEAAADDEAFLKRWAAVKLQAKKRAAAYLKERTGVTVDPNVMFDVQARAPPSALLRAPGVRDPGLLFSSCRAM